MKILKFYTPTCAPCRVVGKILENVDVEVEDINALENIEKVDEYNICTTPTLIFLDDEGEEFQRTVGVVSEGKIKCILNSCK